MREIKYVLTFMLLASFTYAQPTVDSILNLHFEEAGGREHWKQMTSCYAEQSYWTLPIDKPSSQWFIGDQLSKSQKRYYKHPDQYRCTVYRDGKLGLATVISQGEAKFYVYRDKHEVAAPEPEQMKAIQALVFSTYLLGPTPLLLSAFENNVLVYEGEIEVYGKLCYKLVITDGLPLGGQALIYLDAETYRAYALVHAEAMDRHKIYNDYQKVNGLLIPHKISTYLQSAQYEEYTIDKIEINQAIDPSLFTVW